MSQATQAPLDAVSTAFFKKELKTAIPTLLPTFPDNHEMMLDYITSLSCELRRPLPKLLEEVKDFLPEEEVVQLSTWLNDFAQKYPEQQNTLMNIGEHPNQIEEMAINLEEEGEDELMQMTGTLENSKVQRSDQAQPRIQRKNMFLDAAKQAAASTRPPSATSPSTNTTEAKKRTLEEVRESPELPIARQDLDSTEPNVERSAKFSKTSENGRHSRTRTDTADSVTFTVGIGSSDASTAATPLVLPSADSEASIRCTYWPNCSRGSACKFHHPSEPCPDYPNCAKGAQCLYIHPGQQNTGGNVVLCRFGTRCTRPDCNFTHPMGYVPPMGRGRGRGMTGPGQVLNVPCRFYPNCTNLMCPFWHPDAPTSFNGTVSLMSSVPRRSTPPTPTNGNPTPSSNPIVCRFEPYCTRPSCAFFHPSKAKHALEGTENLPKSTKFTEPIDKDPLTNPSGNAGRGRNRSWVNTNATIAPTGNGTAAHISERVYALPDDVGVEQIAVGETTGTVSGEDK
ncbi:hypothetical protein HDU85_004818 [Gaertneriomyces sp. JEL0708]|nr:hypothetical protein HDU85_004818 [Gaertneriomyces sp. JEL0708]